MNTFDIGAIVRKVCRYCRPVTYLFVLFLQAKDILQGRPMNKVLEQKIAIFCSDEEKKNRAYIRRLKRDMIYSHLLYGCYFEEYFMFRFSRLSHSARCEFVPEKEQLALCRRITSDFARKTFWDKWETYQIFREFYHRDVVKIDKTTPFNVFSRFVEKHPQFIVKPSSASCGRGIYIVDTVAVPNIQDIFRQIQQEDAVLEELILQCQAFSALHPESVNTIRCATFLKDGQAQILFTFLRIGQGSSVVDNGGSGGLIASIDVDSGIVITPGVTERCTEYLCHPDTGAQILGMCIPQWEELKKTALKLASVFPEQPYISWDLALTDNGWVMVEGNHAGQFVGPQLTTGQGIRPLLAQYFNL